MFLHTDLLICNKSDWYIQFFGGGFVVWGWVPGWWLISQGREPLCVEAPFTLFRVYFGMVTCFRARLCWGGGG